MTTTNPSYSRNSSIKGFSSLLVIPIWQHRMTLYIIPQKNMNSNEMKLPLRQYNTQKKEFQEMIIKKNRNKRSRQRKKNSNNHILLGNSFQLVHVFYTTHNRV